MRGIVTDTQQFAESVMNLQMKRQNIVLSNIANVDTPSYKPKDFAFEEQLQEQLGIQNKGRLSATNAGHFPMKASTDGFTAEVETDGEMRTIWGADKVNLEKEITKLTKVNLKYSALAQVVKSGYTGIQQIITEAKQ